MSEKKKKKKKKRGHFTPKKEEKNGDGASLLPSPHLCLRVKTKKAKGRKEKRETFLWELKIGEKERKEKKCSPMELSAATAEEMLQWGEWGNAPTNKGGKYLETENRYYSKKRENIQYAIFSQILYYLSFFFNILYCIRLENNSWQNIHIKIHLPIWGFEVL